MSTDPASLSIMDPELEEIFSRRGRPRPFLPTRENIEAYRKRWSVGSNRFSESPLAIDALGSRSAATWKETDTQIPVRDGCKIDARIYTPKERTRNGRPLFVMFHGGGHCLGGLDTEAFACRLLCHQLRWMILDVAYRLAPEHRFPTGINDAYDSVKWVWEPPVTSPIIQADGKFQVAANAASLGADLKEGFIVGGVSGGATYAAIISHLARAEGLSSPITGLFLSVPILSDEIRAGHWRHHIYEQSYQSMKQNRDAPLLNQAMSDLFWDLYQPDFTSPTLYSPLLFPPPSFAGLPPAYLQICGLDPFRDGCFIYDKLLRDQGIQTRLDVYPGLPHGFWTAYPELQATRKWVRDTIEGVGWLARQSRPGKIVSRM